MSQEKYAELVQDLCQIMQIPDSEEVLKRRSVELEGFSVILDYIADDPNAIYLMFDFGITTAGRTLRVFRLMLEANLLIYAQDQAQLGVNPGTGGVILINRVTMGDDIDAQWIIETLTHYIEHGKYWRKNMLESEDEEYSAISEGNYTWMKV